MFYMGAFNCQKERAPLFHLTIFSTVGIHSEDCMPIELYQHWVEERMAIIETNEK